MNKTDEIIKIGKSKRSVNEILDIDKNMRSTVNKIEVHKVEMVK